MQQKFTAMIVAAFTLLCATVSAQHHHDHDHDHHNHHDHGTPIHLNASMHSSYKTVLPIPQQVQQYTQYSNANALSSTTLGSRLGVFSPSININIPATNEQCKQAVIEHALLQDPAYAQARERAEALTRQKIEEWENNPQLRSSAPPVYTIPVVFHIIHKGEAVGSGTNISDAQITSAIDALNRDYRRTATDGGIAQGAGPDTEIEFCLAVRDPNGNATSGINRVDGTVVANYANQGIINSNEVAVKDLSRWPNTDYLNIWVVSEIDNNGADVANPASFTGGTLGYAYLPTNPVTFNAQRDGIVALNLCVGNDPNQTNGYRLWPWGGLLNRTLTHEVGHYLDLYHPFEGNSCSETNCNTQGDLVCDTPPTVQNTNCNSPACSGTQQVENYMDYTGETCANMFSADQTTRMRAAITGPRSALLTSNACTPVNQLDAAVTAIIAPTNSICNTTFTPEVTITNYGSNTLTTVDINYDVDGVGGQTFAWNGNLAAGQSTNVTLNPVTTTAGAHTFNASTSSPNGSADQNPGNDLLSQAFTVVANGNVVEVIINTDCYGYEIYWEITDNSNNVVASGGNTGVGTGGNQTAQATDPGAYGNEITITETLCLPDGCYDFTIYDDWGDGLNGSAATNCTVDGSYTVQDDQGTPLVTMQAVNYGTSETGNFCVPQTPGPPVADFVGTPLQIPVGGTVDFTDLSSGNPNVTSWNWTFNGGTPANSTAQNPTGIQWNAVGFYTVSLTVDNGVGNDTETKVNYVEVVAPAAGGQCDTLTHIAATDTLTFYGLTGNWGYYPGHNEYTMSAYADPHTVVNPTDVQSLLVPVATNDVASAASTVDFHVYDDNNGAPGTILGTQTVAINSLQAQAFNFVDFTTPVPVTGTFWVGYELTYNPGDTFTVFTAQARPAGPATSQVFYNGAWNDVNTLFGGNLQTSLGIDVLLSDGGTVPNFTMSAAQICEGDMVALDGSSSTNTTDYFWDLTGGSPATSTTASENATYATAGTYDVKLYTQGGCRIDSMIQTLTVDPAPSATATPVDASCGATDGSITITASGGTPPYTYSIDGGNTFQTGNTFPNLGAGNYDVVVLDAVGNCPTATQTISIGNSTGPTMAAPSQTDNSCNLACDGTITLSATGGAAPLQYSIDNGVTWQANGTFTGLCAGTYDVIVEDATGCQDINQVIIIEPAAINYSSNTSDATCGNTNGQIDLSGASGGQAPFTYSIDGGVTFQSSAVFPNLAPNSYNVVIQDANGCTVNGTEVIGGGGAITLTSSSTNETCQTSNGTATATPSGGTPPFTYSWSSGGTSQTETGLSAGTYTCTVTDASGCQEVVNVTVTNIGAVNGTVSADQDICAGDTEILVASGGTSYTWDDGSGTVGTGNTLTVSPGTTTTYTVTISDASGCSQVLTTTVTVNQYPVTTVTPDLTICDGETVTLTANGGSSYFWNTTETTQSIDVSPTSQTTYSVIASNGSCTGNTATVTVSVDPSPTAVAGADNLSVPIGTTINFNNNGSVGTSYDWQFGDGQTSTMNSPSHTYGSVGTYTVILTATLGNCTDTDTLTINVGIDGVEDNPLNNAISLFPNPTTGNLTVNVEFGSTQDMVMMVYNALGEVVETIEDRNVYASTYQVNLSQEAEGVYFVRFIVGDDQITHRVVVTR